MDHIESWKNKKCFTGQLQRNIIELNGNYPQHWNDMLLLINKIKPLTLLDVGCGAGAIYELYNKENPEIKYTGVDYAEEAIKFCKDQWGYDEFYVKDYRDLTKDYVSQFDVLLCNGLFTILANGDEALYYVLSLTPKNCIINRIAFTDKDSYYKIYQTPYGNKTYEFYHNETDFNEKLKKYNYSSFIIKNDNNVNSILLTKNK